MMKSDKEKCPIGDFVPPVVDRSQKRQGKCPIGDFKQKFHY